MAPCATITIRLRLALGRWLLGSLIFVVMVAWPRGFHVLSGEPPEKDDSITIWFRCKDQIAAEWAVKDPPHMRERRKLADGYLLHVGLLQRRSATDHLLFAEEANASGVSESELVALGERTLRECGPFLKLQE